MRIEDLVIGNYYIVKRYNPKVGQMDTYIAKLIYLSGKVRVLNCLFEFINYIGGHNGFPKDYPEIGCGGKDGHCWYLGLKDIISSITIDDAMVEML